jgi:hypothetical protein
MPSALPAKTVSPATTTLVTPTTVAAHSLLPSLVRTAYRFSSSLPA